MIASDAEKLLEKKLESLDPNDSDYNRKVADVSGCLRGLDFMYSHGILTPAQETLVNEALAL